jgi:hypothetical protein
VIKQYYLNSPPLSEEEYPKGEVVGEKRIPYLYDSSVFLALPTTPPSGHPSSDGGGELRYSIYLM